VLVIKPAAIVVAAVSVVSVPVDEANAPSFAVGVNVKSVPAPATVM